MAMLFPTLVFLCFLSVNGRQAERELGFATIAGYQPTCDVRDYVSSGHEMVCFQSQVAHLSLNL